MLQLPGNFVRHLLLASLITSLAGCQYLETPDTRTYVAFKPKPLTELRFANTIRQRLDFSCGAATIATILTFYYRDITSEEQVLSVLKNLPGNPDWKEKIKEGFSFSDLIFAAEQFNYAGQGASIDISQLSKINGPMIVHLDKGKFQHFVVLRRMGDGVAYVSDPIIGSINMSMGDFTKYYTGYALAIWKPGEDLPTKSPLEAVKDGTSVSDVVGTQMHKVVGRPHPIL